jgi:UDP-glucose 4-epimerase
MKLLIVGGAGYIGSHMTMFAQEAGHEVVVLDDFSTGHEWAISDCELIRVNLLDHENLAKLLKGRLFDGIIHFAAKSLVSESIIRPDLYYHNNIVGSMNLVNEMIKNGNKNLIFSSTAAIFGNPVTDIISENHPKNPINPYGQSKLIVETFLEDICKVYDMQVTCLRYFNAAGAHPSGKIGEAHDPETHLIPNVIKKVIDKNDVFNIYGNDYPTQDGTCIRDYVHVVDLSRAHMLALESDLTKNFNAFNLGNGQGFSVLEIIKCCEDLLDTKIKYKIDKRRPGDPAKLIANSDIAKKLLGWDPEYTSIDSIVLSAINWHKNFKKK